MEIEMQLEVYKFNKCLLDRLEESMLVLPWKEELITASQVRAQWSCFIELQIEPAGWQAIWNIPRVICEVLHLRYPTAVFGHVEQVLFKELRAVFVVDVIQDQDENVTLVQRHEVALEDLWPTISQENNALNVDRTADCLDRLRFFYSNVFMPWDYDNDDDRNWVERHLESRIRFCYDLRKGSIKRTLAQHIRTLLTEAKYIQQRRELLELNLSDDEEENQKLPENQQVTDLMRLHLRLSMIRNEIEIFENTEMRRIYEHVHFGNDEKVKICSDNMEIVKRARIKQQKQCFVVTQPYKMERQIELLRQVEMQIELNCIVKMVPDLLTALNESKPHDKIFLAPGRHTLKFLEYLNENGFMSGIVNSNSSRNLVENQVIISSPDDDSMLLIFNGDYTLEQLMFDCRNVRTGIMIKSGNVVLRNCHLTGDGKSSTQQGIVCTGKGKLTLIDCTIEKLANGVILHKGTELVLKNTKIKNCKVGLEITAQVSKVTMQMAHISNAEKCGIYVDNMETEHLKAKHITFSAYKDLADLTSWTGDCEFELCKSNIYIVNGKKSLLAAESVTSIMDEDDEE